MRRSTRLVALLLALCLSNSFGDKPANVLKDAIKATLKAESFSTTLRHDGGFSQRADHTVSDQEISGEYTFDTVGKLMVFHAPLNAFRVLGVDGGALEHDGAWISLARERDGRLLMGLATPVVEILAEVKKLAKTAVWGAGGEEGSPRQVVVEGNARLAAAHWVALTRCGYFEDPEQLANAPAAGSDDDFNWKVPEIVERHDKGRGFVRYTVTLDGELITAIERLVVIAVRETQDQPLAQALGGSQHIAWSSHFALSDHGAVEEPQVPREAVRWLR